MESSTAVPTHDRATGSATIADLIGLAAERHGDAPAVRHKRDGAWHDVSYAELGEIVSEVGRGLIDLGIAPGDRVAILCTTRPEWTYADFGIASAGAVAVPIYPTNSPEECEWVAGNSESVAIICEDAAQVSKIRQVRGDLPALETIVVIDPAGMRGEAGDELSEPGDAIPLDTVRARGRARDAAELGSARRRSRASSRTRSSTRRARPDRPRAACSAMATTATWSRWSSGTRSCRRATSRTCSSRSLTRSRC
jgi:long-chain acyl-CoA synthetase